MTEKHLEQQNQLLQHIELSFRLDHLPIRSFSPPTLVAACCLARRHSCRPQLTTTPQSKKRKVEECVTDASRNDPSKTRKTSTLPAQGPSTPITEHSSPSLKAMDSEDDFMSDPPSGDEMDFDEGTQDSDIASLGGGTYICKWPWAVVVADKYFQNSSKTKTPAFPMRRTFSQARRKRTR